MIVRPETPSLSPHIRALLCAAFPTTAEADLVDRLREDGDVAFALVALEGDAVVSHVVLSPMSAPMRALGLGPVAVAPSRQGQGVGRRLIEAALECARGRMGGCLRARGPGLLRALRVQRGGGRGVRVALCGTILYGSGSE
ncbi:MAG TPA: N-acetyltransferase [Hyphomicrobium sp.]|nr:N-acetyltransferase [Hyphomicrobium sp.]HRO51121.1 N-acetyltransferase [Hyphomicrobium sp.]